MVEKSIPGGGNSLNESRKGRQCWPFRGNGTYLGGCDTATSLGKQWSVWLCQGQEKGVLMERMWGQEAAGGRRTAVVVGRGEEISMEEKQQIMGVGVAGLWNTGEYEEVRITLRVLG